MQSYEPKTRGSGRQLTAKRRGRLYCTQVRHPLHADRRVYLSAPTRELLSEQRDHMLALRKRLELGILSRREVVRILRRLEHGPTSVREVLDAYGATLTNPNTRKRFEAHRAYHYAELAELDAEDVDGVRLSEWIARLRERVADSSARTIWNTLKAAFAYARRRGVIDDVPWGGWAPSLSPAPARPPREAARSVDELVALVVAAERMDVAERSAGRYSAAAAVVATGAIMGLRNGELAALGWDDVRDAGDVRELVIRHQAIDGWRELEPTWDRPRYPPKQKTIAALVVPPALARLLDEHREYLRARGAWRPDGPIFPDELGAWLPGACAVHRDLMRRLANDAGLPPGRWTPHSLRDSCVTLEAVGHRGDLRAVQARSRHASLTSLIRYLHGSRAVTHSSLALPSLFPPSAPVAGSDNPQNMCASEAGISEAHEHGMRVPCPVERLTEL